MNVKKFILLFYLLSFTLFYKGNQLFAKQNDANWDSLFRIAYYNGYEGLIPLRKYWMGLSTSGKVNDMQPLSYGLDALLAMYQATDSLSFLKDAIVLTNNVINESSVIGNIPNTLSPFKDQFKGWIDTVSADKDLYHREVPLSESYFFQYVTKLLLIIHNKPTIMVIPVYNEFYNNTLQFIEKNIWEKWEARGLSYERNRYFYLFRLRTHMACHWAYMAADLSFLTKDSVKRTDYLGFVKLFNKMLEENFKKYNNYISWNCTWDYNLNGTLNTERPEIQDVSHANLVVSYIVEAYDLGLWNDTDVVRRIIATLKYKLWDPTDCLFRDNIDGTMFEKGTTRSLGSFQADGFVKLTRYDSSLFPIYEKFISCSPLLKRWYQYGQLFANLALSKKIYGQYSLYPKKD